MSLDEKFMPFKRKINNIITDLLVDGTYQDMMGLQDTSLCSDITILLEDDLNENFNHVELNDIAVKVLGKQTRCSSKECPELKQTKLGNKNKTKEDVCHSIAIFYVRIFNIISAILTAVDYNNNMCVLRLRALFERTEGDVGRVTVCQPNEKLYPSSFLKVSGMAYLLKLYKMYDLPESIQTNSEKKKEIEELQMNIKRFFKEKASDYERENVNQISTNNEVLSSSIRNKIEKIESNMKGVKKGLTNMKDVFQKKGMISNTNIQRLDLDDNNGENTMNMSSKSQNNNSQKTTKTAANSNTTTTSNNRNNNTQNNNTRNNNTRNNNTRNNNTRNNENTNNNLGGLNNEELNVNATNINEISGNSEENLVNQKGGKNKKTFQKKNSKKKTNKTSSPKKSKRKRYQEKQQTGGANFIREIFKKLTGSSNRMVVEDTDENANLNNNVVDKRVKNMKQLADLEKMMSRTKIPESKIISGSDVKVGYVATNLSQKPECKSGDLNATINITDAKMEGFAKKYREFETHYYTQSLDLISFLESNVLKQSKKGNFMVKKFNLKQLDNIEKITRQKLLKYYEKCQNLFTQSFFELVKVLGDKNVSEIENNNNNINEVSVEVNNL